MGSFFKLGCVGVLQVSIPAPSCSSQTKQLLPVAYRQTWEPFGGIFYTVLSCTSGQAQQRINLCILKPEANFGKLCRGGCSQQLAGWDFNTVTVPSTRESSHLETQIFNGQMSHYLMALIFAKDVFLISLFLVSVPSSQQCPDLLETSRDGH